MSSNDFSQTIAKALSKGQSYLTENRCDTVGIDDQLNIILMDGDLKNQSLFRLDELKKGLLRP